MRVRRTHNRMEARALRAAAVGSQMFDTDLWFDGRIITPQYPSRSEAVTFTDLDMFMDSLRGDDGRAQLFGAAIGEDFEAAIKSQAGKVGANQKLLVGYASMTGIEYEMYDYYGLYDEMIAKGAFEKSLAKINSGAAEITHTLDHKVGMATMASERLSVGEDGRGLWMASRVMTNESDAELLVRKIENKSVPGQMSMMGVIRDQAWNRNYDKLTIHEWDLTDGDVASLMLYGANPYTNEEVHDAPGGDSREDESEADEPAVDTPAVDDGLAFLL